MRILIATGIYPPDVGGPAEYARNLKETFENLGHGVEVSSFRIEKKLPTGIRHFWYFFKILPKLFKADFILILDTFSAALPAILAAKIAGKKSVIRIGGDFLWESFVERTGKMIPLPDFYNTKTALSFKEKIIFRLTKFVLKNSSVLAFTTSWQKEIWMKPYGLQNEKCSVVENFYAPKESASANGNPKFKNFIFAGRPIKLKNVERMEESFLRAKETGSDASLHILSLPHHLLMESIKSCYAVILPSLSEVSPNFILEAIRFNKPFILTKHNGLNDRVKDIGLLVDPLNIDDIKEKILSLANDKIYAEQMNKIKSFNFTHSWPQIAEEILKISE